MNDKINELIKQATLRYETYPAGCDGHPEVSFYFDRRGFAELIVKECIDLMKAHQAEREDCGYYGSTEYYDMCRAQAAAFESAASSIGYHFGVKL